MAEVAAVRQEAVDAEAARKAALQKKAADEVASMIAAEEKEAAARRAESTAREQRVTGEFAWMRRHRAPGQAEVQVEAEAIARSQAAIARARNSRATDWGVASPAAAAAAALNEQPSSPEVSPEQPSRPDLSPVPFEVTATEVKIVGTAEEVPMKVQPNTDMRKAFDINEIAWMKKYKEPDDHHSSGSSTARGSVRVPSPGHNSGSSTAHGGSVRVPPMRMSSLQTKEPESINTARQPASRQGCETARGYTSSRGRTSPQRGSVRQPRSETPDPVWMKKFQSNRGS
jgi:hypothetical protein